jgi:DNA-binding transcriptional MerR regulator
VTTSTRVRAGRQADGWSTREIAELAGTTARAVRHYHSIGLLPLPERLPNGHKNYGVDHLDRLRQISRLAGLGFPLARISTLIDSGVPADALRTLDSELAATIERLQRTRAELAQLLAPSAPAGIPAPVSAAAARAGLSDADRTLLATTTRYLYPQRSHAGAGHLQLPPADPVSPADLVSAVATRGPRRADATPGVVSPGTGRRPGP